MAIMRNHKKMKMFFLYCLLILQRKSHTTNYKHDNNMKKNTLVISFLTMALATPTSGSNFYSKEMSEQYQWSLVLSALLLCHYLADFCLTTKSMIRAKSNGKEYYPILLHAGVHAVLMTLVLEVFGVSLHGCVAAFLIELVSHFLIDTLKSKLSIKYEVLRDNTQKPYWMVYGFDQLLHILVVVAIIGLCR